MMHMNYQNNTMSRRRKYMGLTDRLILVRAIYID
jgi:hypothetical protein